MAFSRRLCSDPDGAGGRECNERVSAAEPEKEAFKKVEAILDPKVIRLAGDDGAPMPIQSNVDGAKLAAFIDAAVADSIRELEKREDDLSKAGVTMLENVDGRSMVEQMSPQFLEFVLDAYRSLKYTQ